MSQNLTVVPTTAQSSGGASLTLPTEKTLLQATKLALKITDGKLPFLPYGP